MIEIKKKRRQDSGLCIFLFAQYSEKGFARIYGDGKNSGCCVTQASVIEFVQLKRNVITLKLPNIEINTSPRENKLFS